MDRKIYPKEEMEQFLRIEREIPEPNRTDKPLLGASLDYRPIEISEELKVVFKAFSKKLKNGLKNYLKKKF